MRGATLFSLLPLLSFLPGALAGHGLPRKIYGVNLGSWLVVEPWMLPQEWLNMGGENNCDCTKCIGSEFALTQANPATADKIFEGHWSSWFNQTDVDELVAAGINTVRIPLGYWIVEDLVDRDTEFFPRGGLRHLRRGLKALKKAGIVVILDHHALPGAQAVKQQFAGRCVIEPQFYTAYNYHRALVWTSVMTALSHVDPVFDNVVSIQAVNEIIMDSSKTPGYGDFQKNFVQTVRATEFLLGVAGFSTFGAVPAPHDGNFTAMIPNVGDGFFNAEVRTSLLEAFPILLKMGVFGLSRRREQLITSFMDVSWQWNNPPNPADAALGPQAYDNHLYYVFGGVADANEEAYMKHICNLDRVRSDAALGNSPLFFGEWGLPTQFSATDAFLMKWADAQKLQYSKGAGWIFWNFKVEKSKLAGDMAREWSYLEGVRRGYFTKDPAQYHDENVCVPYLNGASSSASATATSAASSTAAASTTAAATSTAASSTTAAASSTASS